MNDRQMKRKRQTALKKRRRIGLFTLVIAVAVGIPVSWRGLAHANTVLPNFFNALPNYLNFTKKTPYSSATNAATNNLATGVTADTTTTQYVQTTVSSSANNATSLATNTSAANQSTNQTETGAASENGTNGTKTNVTIVVHAPTPVINTTNNQTATNQANSTAGNTAEHTGTGSAENPHGSSVAKTTTTPPLPAKVVLSVPPQNQLPALPNGCEATSLSMLLTAVGHPVSNLTLANEEPKDPTQLVLGPNKTITYWGDPNKGFVGDVTGYGYGIYHGPITQLINQILPGRAEDLTHQPFSTILSKVAQGTPVMVWTTANFEPEPPDQWITWQSPEGPIHATMWEHVVLVVGYDAGHIYINDPLDGTKAKPVDRKEFLASWEQMGQQAVTIKPASKD